MFCNISIIDSCAISFTSGSLVNLVAPSSLSNALQYTFLKFLLKRPLSEHSNILFRVVNVGCFVLTKNSISFWNKFIFMRFLYKDVVPFRLIAWRSPTFNSIIGVALVTRSFLFCFLLSGFLNTPYFLFFNMSNGLNEMVHSISIWGIKLLKFCPVTIL